MPTPFPMPKFVRSRDAQRAARGSLAPSLFRPTVIADMAGADVDFHIAHGQVEFRLTIAEEDAFFDVNGWFPADGADGAAEIGDVVPEDMNDDDLIDTVTEIAEKVLDDIAAAWLTVPATTRLDMARHDAVETVHGVAAEWYLRQRWHSKARGEEAAWFADRLRAAQCRATAYTVNGPIGETARRLVGQQSWAGNAEELLLVAEGVCVPA